MRLEITDIDKQLSELIDDDDEAPPELPPKKRITTKKDTDMTHVEQEEEEEERFVSVSLVSYIFFLHSLQGFIT